MTLQALRSAILFASVVYCLGKSMLFLDFALWCFTDGSSKPWTPSMLHFFLWALYHATGSVSAWIAENIYLPLRKHPKSVDVSKTKTSRSQKYDPIWELAVELQGCGAGCGRMRCICYPHIAKTDLFFTKIEEPGHSWQEMPLAHNSNSSGQVWRWALRNCSTHTVPSQGLLWVSSREIYQSSLLFPEAEVWKVME